MQKKYKFYNALSLSLKRAKIENYSKLATFFLDTFLENQGQIRAAKAYKIGLCSEDEKDFRDWRKNLCDLEWLEFVIENNKSVTYRPGKKLVKYLNREKQARSEMASMDDIRAATEPLATKEYVLEADSRLERKLEKAEREIEKMKSALDMIINKIDPPSDEQKREKFMFGGYALRLISQKNDTLS